MLLTIIPYVPHPPFGGGEIRLHRLLAALLTACKVRLYGLTRTGDQPQGWPLADRFHPGSEIFQGRETSPAGHFSRLRQNVFSRMSFAQPRFIQGHDDCRLWKALDNLGLEDIQAVHVESLAMAPYALALKMRKPALHCVLSMDNIDIALRLRQLLREGRHNSPRAIMWRLIDIYRTIRFTRYAVPRFDTTWLCSEIDLTLLGRWTRLPADLIIPNGVAADDFPPPSPVTPQRLTFVGSMSDGPNADGALFFAGTVLPLIRNVFPETELWLVGKDPAPALRDLALRQRNIFVTGTVDDVRPYLQKTTVALAPLRYATGTRLKILEAMAAGCPVVSTHIGAEGLHVTDGDTIILADSPAKLAQACIGLLADAGRCGRIGTAGRELVRARYDWSIVMRPAVDYYRGRC